MICLVARRCVLSISLGSCARASCVMFTFMQMSRTTKSSNDSKEEPKVSDNSLQPTQLRCRTREGSLQSQVMLVLAKARQRDWAPGPFHELRDSGFSRRQSWPQFGFQSSPILAAIRVSIVANPGRDSGFSRRQSWSDLAEFISDRVTHL